MKLKMRGFAGFGLLVVAAAVVALTMSWSGSNVTTIKGWTGGSKISFLTNPQLLAILRDRYGLAVDYAEVGSGDMTRRDSVGQDFLWPGNEAVVERHKSLSRPLVQSENIVVSPLVIYSWDTVTDCLVSNGIAQQSPKGHYTVDMPKLVQVMNAGTSWHSLGCDRHGKVLVFTSDPSKSSGGLMFGALLAGTLNNGEVVTSSTLPALLPSVREYFDRQGLMESTTANLFDKFLTQGPGSYPLVAAYESELIEFKLAHPEHEQLLRERVRVLYPQPTVWATHPFMALTDNGARLLMALDDPDSRRIAWERHGFRPGRPGATIDPTVLGLTGIPEAIDAAMQLPSQVVLDEIGKVQTSASPPR